MPQEPEQDVNLNYLATVVDRLAHDVQAFEGEGLRREGPPDYVRHWRLSSLLLVLGLALCVPIGVVMVVDRATAPLDGAIRLIAALLVVTALGWVALCQLLVRWALWDYPRDVRLAVQPAFVESLTEQITKAAQAGVVPPQM